MPSSHGLLAGGVQWSEVELSKNPAAVGDTCSIYLSQEATSQDSWHIIVRALFDEGGVTMGDFEAEPPGPGVLPSRLVAVANAPGAIGWAISANAPNPNARAAAWLASNKCSCGNLPGLTVIRNGPRNPTARRILTDGHGANGGAPVSLLGIGSQLWRIEGDLQQVGVAAGTVVMLFDQVVAPAAGDFPIFSELVGQEGIGAPSSPAHYVYEGDRRYGRPVNHNLWLATSTTGGVFTPDPGHSVDFHLVSSPP